jgi:hypothetical protein
MGPVGSPRTLRDIVAVDARRAAEMWRISFGPVLGTVLGWMDWCRSVFEARWAHSDEGGPWAQGKQRAPWFVGYPAGQL